MNLSPEVRKLIREELEGVYKDKGPKVLISNGNIVTKNTRTKFRKDDQRQATLLTNEGFVNPLSLKFINYLNTLPYIRFTKLCRYIPLAQRAVEALDDEGLPIIKPEARIHQLAILQSIEEQPQPFYTSCFNSQRIFEMRKGLQGISSHLRKIITQGSTEIDIQNAHLAIVAALWDIPEIQDYLAKGESIWKTLIPTMGFSYPNPKVKSDLKEFSFLKANELLCNEFFYGVIYGMSRKNLARDMVTTFGINAYRAFIKHPFIKALFKARNKRIKDIAMKEEHITPLGRKVIAFSPREKSVSEVKPSQISPLSITTILSLEASELEMMLLEPIVDLAILSDDFHILLYQFDGFTIQFKDEARRKPTLSKLKSAVEERAKQYGIITTLTWTHL